jgi:hypothetical protein
MAISFGNVSGSLRSGHWKIDDMKLRRRGDDESNFNLLIDNVEFTYKEGRDEVIVLLTDQTCGIG